VTSADGLSALRIDILRRRMGRGNTLGDFEASSEATATEARKGENA
jgi:hypothetical protein